jgi:hypothetical protein
MCKPRKITPPQYAERLGVSPEKVIAWIRNGELRAMDASTKRGGWPRYLIDEKDAEAFELSRQVVTPPPQRGRRRKNLPPGFVRHFRDDAA